jgi:hypothetical protein
MKNGCDLVGRSRLDKNRLTAPLNTKKGWSDEPRLKEYHGYVYKYIGK